MGARELSGSGFLRQRTPVRRKRDVGPSDARSRRWAQPNRVGSQELSPSGRWGVHFARGERRKSGRQNRRWSGSKKNWRELGPASQGSFERFGIAAVGVFILPFAFPGFANSFAEMTRRFAGKGFFQSTEQSGFLRVVPDHACPSNRLQSSPMAAA